MRLSNEEALGVRYNFDRSGFRTKLSLNLSLAAKLQ